MKYNEKNKPLVCMMTQSTCYKGTTKMTPKGVLWHSTGANNPSIKRYVQPDDNDPNKQQLISLIGKNSYNNDWNHVKHQAGLNAWIGKLADGTVATVQTMPWDYKPWGCGSGSNGSCNNGWMQFEICEDNLKDRVYFEAIYQEACELTAYYCKMYNLDPRGTVKYNGVEVPVILCHADSYKLKLGSNHGDIYHWFKKYGKTMEDVREDVAKIIESSVAAQKPESNPVSKPEVSNPNTNFREGDLVRLTESATYYNGKAIPSWVKSQNWYIKTVKGERAVIDKSENGKYSINSPVNIKYLLLIKNKEESFQPFLVRINVDILNYRKGPGTQYEIRGTVKKGEVYTIVAVQGEWGKLKSGAGWIYLPYTTRK